MKISAIVLEGILAKMKDTFNSTMEIVSPSYNLDPLLLEFPDTIYDENTLSVVLGKLPPTLIEEMGVTQLSKVCIYPDGIVNNNFEKPRDFSGVVQIGLDFYLEWAQGCIKQNFSTMYLLLEDVLLDTFSLIEEQNYGPQIVYNGDFNLRPSPLQEGQQSSYRQLASLRMTFEAHS